MPSDALVAPKALAAVSLAMSSMFPLSQAARRRILADLKALQEEPVPLAAAAPCSDADLSLWNGVIGTQMEVTQLGCVTD